MSGFSAAGSVAARWALAGALLAVPAALPAQERQLDRVEALVQQGEVAQAREVLSEWWSDGRSAASRVEQQRGFWLRGRLTVDPELALRDFHRLALEFPGGPYSAGALLRVGWEAQSRGALVEAAAAMERVARDYPGTDEAGTAQAWSSRWSESVALARSREPAPPREAGAVASAPAAGTSAPAPAPAAAATGDFAVQLGAFRSVERARVVEDQAREAGLSPRIVRVEGSDLIRIRVGRFDTSRAATDEMNRIRRLGLDAAVVRNAAREEPVR